MSSKEESKIYSYPPPPSGYRYVFPCIKMIEDEAMKQPVIVVTSVASVKPKMSSSEKTL